MRLMTNHKARFLLIGLVAVFLLTNGVCLAAEPSTNAQTSSLPVFASGQGSAYKASSIAEINQYLSRMNPKELAATLKLFRSMQLLKWNYLTDVSTESMMAGAVRGAVNSLNDPYSVYMDEKMNKDFMSAIHGSFEGVGIVLGVKDSILTVVAPIDGTPAAEAGVLPGDQVIKIDDKDTKDLSLDEAVGLIRGPKGTRVTLTVRRAGEELSKVLIRATIVEKTVSAKMLDDNIAYIRVSQFSETTGADFAAAYRDMEEKGMRAIILDMRNNPGGLVNECVKVANFLVPKGPVVSEIQRDGTRKTHESTLAQIKYPLAVLVNGGSASASEIVAGAIQDTEAGTLIGTKTFGKGVVQRLISLDEATALKYTYAKYVTPKERSINGVGITPDIVIEVTAPVEAGKDPQLDKALEVLKGKLQ